MLRQRRREAGLIAYLKDGDEIVIDMKKRKINANLSSKEIEKRRKNMKILLSKVKSGYLYRYSKLVGSASKGAVYEGD